jgi:thioredoxin reductase (NADPH)
MMTTTMPADPGLAPMRGLDANTFPVLTPEQLSRAATYGRKRSVDAGEVLVEVGDQNLPIFIIMEGKLQVVRPTADGEDLVTEGTPGQFTGEVSTLSGRPAMLRLRAVTRGEVIQIDHDHLLSIVQTDFELSEILMRAFVLRRLGLARCESESF